MFAQSLVSIPASNRVTRLSSIALFEATLESCIDGIIILTEQGEWLQMNQAARQLCQRLMPSNASWGQIPQYIWQACLTLIQSRRDFPDQSIVVESEVAVDSATLLRVRVKWFSIDETAHPYIMVILEDRYQSIQNVAIAEVDRYQLTPREAEVWLLYRMSCSYKAIAKDLGISCNTVKKHMKNIHAKRQMAEFE